MKKIVLVLIILGILTSCSSAKGTGQNLITQEKHTEDLYNIPFELDTSLMGLSEQEVVEAVREAYSKTRLITDIYLNDESRYMKNELVINVYDPLLESALFVPEEDGFHELPEENKDKWVKYLEQYGLQSIKIDDLVVNNGVKDLWLEDSTVTTSIYIHLDNVKEVDIDHVGEGWYAWISIIYPYGYQINGTGLDEEIYVTRDQIE